MSHAVRPERRVDGGRQAPEGLGRAACGRLRPTGSAGVFETYDGNGRYRLRESLPPEVFRAILLNTFNTSALKVGARPRR